MSVTVKSKESKIESLQYIMDIIDTYASKGVMNDMDYLNICNKLGEMSVESQETKPSVSSVSSVSSIPSARPSYTSSVRPDSIPSYTSSVRPDSIHIPSSTSTSASTSTTCSRYIPMPVDVPLPIERIERNVVSALDVHTNDYVYISDLDTGIYNECPNCHVMTEKISGCNYVTCQCGTRFTYVSENVGVNNPIISNIDYGYVHYAHNVRPRVVKPREYINPMTGRKILKDGKTYNKLRSMGIEPVPVSGTRK
jgi:hypothetical protein